MPALPLLAAATVCGTLQLMPPGPPPVFEIPETFGRDKEIRDAFGDEMNVATSENFALKWGDDVGLNGAISDLLLSQMEETWRVEVVELEMPAPAGTDTHLFNVYLGDTGSGTPETYGVNYHSFDPDGWPMIVLHPGNLDYPEYAGTTIAHEFFHAVQTASEAYIWWEDDDPRAWYWEATASWSGGEVFPENYAQASLLYGYAFQPHQPLSFFNLAGAGGEIDTLHQYGAFIFLRYLTERVAEPTLVSRSWTQAGTFSEPIEVLNELLLEGQATSIDELFPRYAAGNATWDYERGAMYEEMLESSLPYILPGEDQRIVEVVDGATDGWVSVPAATWPSEYGYNVVLIEQPAAGAWQLGFAANDEGSDGSRSNLAAVVVIDEETGPAYLPLVDDLELELTGSDDVYLVVSALDGENTSERFGWEYRFEVVVPEPEPEGDGCACTAGSSAAPSGTLLLLMLLGIRRKR
jgi:MYXO-CTERM domain-containing protein